MPAVANALIADSLLEAVPNRAHRQSPLIVLTAKCEKAVHTVRMTRTDDCVWT